MNQSDLLQNILAVEHQARAMTEDARNQSQNLDASIEAEIGEIQARYAQNAEEYLRRLQKSEQKKQERRLREIDERTEKRLRQIEEIYAAEKDRWVEEIFQRIVGKEGG